MPNGTIIRCGAASSPPGTPKIAFSTTEFPEDLHRPLQHAADPIRPIRDGTCHSGPEGRVGRRPPRPRVAAKPTTDEVATTGVRRASSTTAPAVTSKLALSRTAIRASRGPPMVPATSTGGPSSRRSSMWRRFPAECVRSAERRHAPTTGSRAACKAPSATKCATELALLRSEARAEALPPSHTTSERFRRADHIPAIFPTDGLVYASLPVSAVCGRPHADLFGGGEDLNVIHATARYYAFGAYSA